MRRWRRIMGAVSLVLAALGDHILVAQARQDQSDQGDVQPPPVLVANLAEDGCEPASTLEFSMSTARLSLSAQSDLASAVNWVLAEPGRFLVLVAPPSPRPGDAQLGRVRAVSANQHLIELGVNPAVTGVGTYEGYLTPREQSAMGAGDVVVLECVPTP